MKEQPAKPNRIIRLGALLSLVVWIGGQVVCQASCLGQSRDCHPAPAPEPQADVSSCHAGEAASVPSCHAAGDATTPGSDTSSPSDCACALQLIKQDARSADVVVPAGLILVALLSDTHRFPSSTAMLPQQGYLREQGWRNWAWTPEVYLGPAIHSQAPPVSSFHS